MATLLPRAQFTFQAMWSWYQETRQALQRRVDRGEALSAADVQAYQALQRWADEEGMASVRQGLAPFAPLVRQHFERLAQAAAAARQEALDRSRNKLRDLRQGPLAVLSATPIWVGDFAGGDSHLEEVRFIFDGERMVMGSHSFLAAFGLGGGEGVISVRCAITPMRGHSSPGRLSRTRRFLPTQAKLWITPQQTGCSVLIVDWGLLGCSMIHAQPHESEQFSSLSRRFMGDRTSRRTYYKDFWLKKDLAQAASSSSLFGEEPQRYILVQSMNTASADFRLQIIGVPTGSSWTFYLQRYQYTKYYIGLTCQRLQWTTWSRYLPFFGY